MNHIQKQTIEGTELTLTGEQHDYLGPGLVLRQCRVVLRTAARALTMTDVRFVDCVIEAKRKLVDLQMWCGAQIEGCTFKGQFVGNDFGHWPEQHPNGSIERCDFSGATLDGCRFMGCDATSLKLPTWPCIAVVEPSKYQREIEVFDWPGRLRRWATGLLEEPRYAACVDDARTVAKRYECSESELREALGHFGKFGI